MLSTSSATGDNDARFEELYHQHFRLVWSVLASFGVPPSAREDAAQDTWALVYRKQDLLREDASPRAWVAAMARGVARRHHRTTFRRQRRESAYARVLVPFAQGPEARVEAGDAVEALLGELSPEQRLVYVLTHGYGLSAREVAQATGVSGNTVSSRLRLARRTVRRIVQTNPQRREALQTALWALPNPGARKRISARLGLATTSILGLGSAAALKPVFAGLIVAFASASPMRPVAHAPQSLPDLAAVVALETPVPRAASPVPAQPAPRIAPPRPAARPGPRAVRSSSKRPSLGAEARVLFAARDALDRGRPMQTLSLIQRHVRRFPESSLVDVREGLRVQALCRLDRDQEARDAAEAVPPAIRDVAIRRCEASHDGDENPPPSEVEES